MKFRRSAWAEFYVSGMSCGHCVARVTTVLKQLSGVRRVRVDLKAQRVRVDHDGADPVALATALAEAGYPVVE